MNPKRLDFKKDETVNALYGNYVKTVRNKGFIQSDMADKIMKFSFQIMDAFNDIRNNKSFAHDNQVLNYEESVLIFSNVSAMGNYRFKEAEDQKSCIVKIYSANPTYFKNLMSSIAEDNLGELLLVYKDGEKNIVLDGNRRLAALKVLNNPQKFSPSTAIKDHADALLKAYTVDLANVSAQVSNDKQLIYKTVYERHAAGQGKARINWSAYGAARFRYDQKMEDGNEWYAIALLLETESKHPEWTAFMDSGDYSHEVFRRIFRAAQDKGVISNSIFSGRHQRIKSTADKKLVKDAIEKVTRFLEAMRNKDLSLSRSGKYADKASVDAFVEQFSFSPDNVRSQAPTDSTAETGGQSPINPSAGSSPTATNSTGSDPSSSSATDLYSTLNYSMQDGTPFDGYLDLILHNNLDGGSYCEPYAGGASIALGLLIEDYVSEIHINDYDKAIYSFWHAILRDTDEFIKRIWDTPVTMTEWRKQRAIQSDKDNYDHIDLGFSTFFMNRTNRSGVIKAGVIGGNGQTGNFKIDARYNKADLVKRINTIANLSDHIHIYRLDALNLITETLPDNDVKGLVFLDPPYYIQGKQLYTNFYTHNDHQLIADAIKSSSLKHWIGIGSFIL
eukprot:gene919-926_t